MKINLDIKTNKLKTFILKLILTLKRIIYQIKLFVLAIFNLTFWFDNNNYYLAVKYIFRKINNEIIIILFLEINKMINI